MKYMILAYESEDDYKKRQDESRFEDYMKGWAAFGEVMRAAGVYDTGLALEGPETATVVSVRNGKRTVEDGPFPDTKEQLGGFCLVDAKDIDEAVDWARKCPSAETGFVDVRGVPYLGEGDE